MLPDRAKPAILSLSKGRTASRILPLPGRERIEVRVDQFRQFRVSTLTLALSLPGRGDKIALPILRYFEGVEDPAVLGVGLAEDVVLVDLQLHEVVD